MSNLFARIVGEHRLQRAESSDGWIVAGRRGTRILASVLVFFLGWWPAAPSGAGESVPPAPVLGVSPESSVAFLTNVPPEARHVAPVLRHVVDVVQSSIEFQRNLKQLRSEQDSVKTKLTTVNGELEILARHRSQLEEQLAGLERQQQERIGTLLKELEAKLERELAQASQEITGDLEQEFARQVQAFDSRHHDAIEQSLDQELQLKERELQQLSQEIEAQTQELLYRLERLEANPDLSKSLQQSTTQALAKRKAELEARRRQLSTERDAMLSQQRAGFIEQVKQQQVVEQERRLTLKEATLRSAIAELLHKARLEETDGINQVKKNLDELRQRYNTLAQEQTSLKARIQSLEQEVAANTHRLEVLEAERQSSLARLEQEFHKPNPGLRVEAIAWLGQVISNVPPELATDLGLLQQRLTSVAEQERQLQEQRRVLRERQLALQLSREMELQYQRAQLRQRQEQDVRAQKASELLTKAQQLADRGKFDEALAFVSQAQALNPPQMNQVTAAREELLSAKEQALRQAQTAELERLFAQAKAVFEQGRYDEAVTLFEHVIQQEATLNSSGGVTR